MAKFVTYYNLCPIQDTKDFLGVSQDREEGNILTTLGRNIIVIIKISTQKQIKSWTVLDRLSSKVLFDPKSLQYVGVFGNRYIRCWDETVTDVNKVKKFKFHKSIADIVHNGSEEILVLYTDGSCESLSSAIQSRKLQGSSVPDVDTLKNQFWDPKVFALADGRRLLTYFQKYEDKAKVELVTVTLDDINSKQLATSRFHVRRADQDVTLSGYSVIEGQSGVPSLLTIWSDKRLFLLTLDDDISKEDIPGNFVSMIHILKVDCPLSILGVSRNSIAIYGANSTQEGSSLILYNTQFKVVQAKQFFKIYFDFSRLWTIGSNILLAMGHNLSVVAFRMSKQLLSELVGSQVSNEIRGEVGDDFINEEDEIEEILRFNESGGSYLPPKCEAKDVVTYADGKTIPFEPIDKFDNQFNMKLLYNVEVDVFQSDSSDIDLDVMTNYSDTGFRTKEIEIIAKALEKCGCSEHEITEKLLAVLIKAELDDDIATCLRRYGNVSEKMLAKTLKYAVAGLDGEKIESMDVGQTETGAEEQMEVDESELPEIKRELGNLDIFLKNSPKPVHTVKRSNLINAVLSCSVDTDCILVHIRKQIDFKEVLIIFEHLYKFISNPDATFDQRNDNQVQFDDMKALQWFGIFLTTHFQKLALSKSVQLMDLLTKWYEILGLYKNELASLQLLSAQLYNLVDKKKINKEKNYSKWYSIEEVKLY